MKSSHQTVSIIVPLFNCAPYLERCIESLLSQTHEDIQILISDDASTDGSCRIAEAYAAKDARIELYKQPVNIGLLENYNFLFKKATGAFITILDSDDWAEPDRIEKQLKLLISRPDIALVGTQATFHYPDGKAVAPQPEKSREINGIIDDFPSVPATILFRRELLQNVAGMHAYFKGGTSMDRYFIMELLEGRKGWHIAEPLYHARVHPGSNHRSFNIHKLVTVLLFDELLEQRRLTGTDWLKSNNMAAIKNWEEAVLANKKIMVEKYRELAVFQIDAGNLKAAVPWLLKAIKLSPFPIITWKTVLYLIRKKLMESEPKTKTSLLI